mgnify:FL=1|jgi:hypothetical protein
MRLSEHLAHLLELASVPARYQLAAFLEGARLEAFHFAAGAGAAGAVGLAGA